MGVVLAQALGLGTVVNDDEGEDDVFRIQVAPTRVQVKKVANRSAIRAQVWCVEWNGDQNDVHAPDQPHSVGMGAKVLEII